MYANASAKWGISMAIHFRTARGSSNSIVNNVSTKSEQ